MSVLKDKGNKELIVSCECNCCDSIHIKVESEEYDDNYFAFVTYMNGNWYRDQNNKIIHTIAIKLKKIWAIIRNKDFYYSEIMMSREDFSDFKEFMNQFGE